MYYAASKELVDTEITMCPDGVIITTINTTSTVTSAVGATAKTTLEIFLSMSVFEEEIDKETSLFEYPQSLARNKTRYSLLLPLIYKQFH
jgi:hypothetical protein